MIGSIKYSGRSRISVHHGAAICIGRKGLFNKIVSKEYKERRISSRNRHVKSSDLPERNNLKLGVYWKELKENIMKDKQHKKKCRLKKAEYSTSLEKEMMPVIHKKITKDIKLSNAMNISVGTSS